MLPSIYISSCHQKESCQYKQLEYIYQGDMQLDGAEEQSQNFPPPQSSAGLDHKLSTQIASVRYQVAEMKLCEQYTARER
jgi:hypothetical protein